MKTNVVRVFAIAGLILLSACCTASAQGRGAGVINDPLEPMNRAVFSFNDVVDKYVVSPVAKAYKAVLPQPVRNSVHSFLINIEAPVNIANNLLQGNVKGAGNTSARFLMNTTVGIAGFYDFAETKGFHYQPADFGQTLSSWGVGSGPYLVLPLIGPSTLRETAGLVVDSTADPVRIVSNNTDEEWIYYTKTGVDAIDTRANLLSFTDDLRKNNLDYYTATKTSYFQNRMKMLYDTHTLKKNAESSAQRYEELE